MLDELVNGKEQSRFIVLHGKFSNLKILKIYQKLFVLVLHPYIETINVLILLKCAVILEYAVVIFGFWTRSSLT